MSCIVKPVYYTCKNCEYEGETEYVVDEDDIITAFENYDISIVDIFFFTERNILTDSRIEDFLNGLKILMEKSPYFKEKITRIVKEW